MSNQDVFKHRVVVKTGANAESDHIILSELRVDQVNNVELTSSFLHLCDKFWSGWELGLQGRCMP